MPLSVGDMLGPYKILAPIGAGGMGEVYRAHDTRLHRDVAVKVLPEPFARDEDRMRRFEQEARAVATLNHPNVLAIYDVGARNGVPYLVSELLQGESLRQTLRHGPLPARKAGEYARQIADGLAAAHEKRLIHRDLKPENLFLTASGRIKILDFGLAKVSASGNSASAPDAATVTLTNDTSPGMVMGTPGYMAPEQVRGEAVDHRADLFSLGATIYEMLTGNRAFKGETAIETLNAILKEDPPDLEGDKAHIPPALQRIVGHCLQKRPADRFQSARDLEFALGSALDVSTSAPPHSVPVLSSKRKLAAVALLSAAIGAGVAYWFTNGAASFDRTEFAIGVPGEVSHVALSPDGKWLAFICPGDNDGRPTVFVQRIGAASSRAIPGSEGASYPFWSPDDQYVAFFANGKLRKAAISGGPLQSLAAVGSAPRGGSWGSKGIILYAPDSAGPIWRVNADGTGAAAITQALRSAHEPSHRWPYFLPDGDHFLMYAGSLTENEERTNTIFLESVARPGRTALFHARSSAAYGSGQIYYADENNALVQAALDRTTARVVGAPHVIAAKVARSPSTFYTAITASENSTLVYSANNNANQSQLTWYDESGKMIGHIGPVGVLANPAISPDGNRVAFDINDSKARNIDVWILDLRNGGASRFTFAPSEETMPVWSRDGSSIAYRSQTGNPYVYIKRADGREPPRGLVAGASLNMGEVATSWSTGDRELLGMVRTPNASTDLVILSADGGGKWRPFLTGRGNKSYGQISPDGRWVVYASDESGESEIYVTTYPEGKGKWQVSPAGGSQPRWRADNKAVFFVAPNQVLTEATVSIDGEFSTTGLRPLFTIHARAPISYTDLMTYDVTPDGKRFLVNQYVKPEHAPPLNIVIHADRSSAK
jgi:serine/threonine protein kinase/Tol biopolymer transport system component